jgi:hypothetical protein
MWQFHELERRFEGSMRMRNAVYVYSFLPPPQSWYVYGVLAILELMM